MSKPEWVKNEYGVDYGDVIQSWGFEVLRQESVGDYQGDILVLLRDGDRCGFLAIGYGSCSGCDALQAAEPWDSDGDWSDVVTLAEQLRSDIHWDSAEGLANWLTDEQIQELKWLWHDDDARPVMADYARSLSAPAE